MKIQQIQYNSTNSSTSFKSAFHNARALQNIPGINCACCDREVITLDRFESKFTTITKPLKELMEKGLLDKWKDELPKLWNVLTHFTEKYPEDSFDTIVQRDEDEYTTVRKTFSMDARESYPEQSYNQTERLAKKAYKALLYDTRENLGSASQIVGIFKEFKKYLSDSPLQAFEQLQIYAQKYPNLRLSEIVQLDEVYNLHKTQHELTLKKFWDKQDYHFNNVIALVRAEDPLAILYFQRAERTVKKIMYTDPDVSARRPRVKEYYENAIKFMKCENIKDAIMEELDQIPVSYPREDAFFVEAKENNWNDAVIIKNIFKPFCGTMDHFLARSKGGADSIYNNTVMCEECNHAKSNKDFNIHLKFHPDMPKYLQKQVDYVRNAIIDKKITADSLVRWPVLFPENVNYSTGGVIHLEYGDYKDKAVELSEEKCQGSITRIEELRKANEALNEQKEELKEKIHQLYRTMRENLDEIETRKTWLKKNQRDVEFFKKDDYSEEVQRLFYTPQSSEEHEEFPDDFSGDCG